MSKFLHFLSSLLCNNDIIFLLKKQNYRPANLRYLLGIRMGNNNSTDASGGFSLTAAFDIKQTLNKGAFGCVYLVNRKSDKKKYAVREIELTKLFPSAGTEVLEIVADEVTIKV